MDDIKTKNELQKQNVNVLWYDGRSRGKSGSGSFNKIIPLREDISIHFFLLFCLFSLIGNTKKKLN